ncbi:MAG: glucosaminidase domain-containing protein [Actinobacteria bacterium]|nr:glucosaminidase domain-containing protein [Actinomycetota bacterium]
MIALTLALVCVSAGTPAGAEDPPALDITTPVTTPDGQQDPEALDALTETLALAPTDSPPSPDDPFVAPVVARAAEKQAAVLVFETTKRSDDANLASLFAAGEAKAAKKTEDADRAWRDRLADQLEVERDRLGQLTISAYVSGGDLTLLGDQAMLEGDTTDPLAGRMIMFEQVLEQQNQTTEKAITDLAAAEKDLRAAVAARKAADDRLQLAMRSSADRDRERLDALARHQQAVTKFDTAVQRLRTAPRGVMAPLEIALIGLPRLSAEDLSGWFEASPYRSKIATPITDIAQWFIEEGRAEGIRGDVAFVQAVLETGGFTNGDSIERNNYSGIGHYDDVAAGWAFPTARDGVRAQIQLLKSYAVKQPNYAQPLVDKRLRGPAGCCETWGDLTTVWATDPTYGPKVMLLYTSLLDYALDRRAAGEGLDFP